MATDMVCCQHKFGGTKARITTPRPVHLMIRFKNLPNENQMCYHIVCESCYSYKSRNNDILHLQEQCEDDRRFFIFTMFSLYV